MSTLQSRKGLIVFKESHDYVVTRCEIEVKPIITCSSCEKRAVSTENTLTLCTDSLNSIDDRVAEMVRKRGRCYFMPVGWSSSGAKGVFCPNCK